MKKILIGILMMAVICLINPMSAIAAIQVGVDAHNYTWYVTDDFESNHFESGALNGETAVKHLIKRYNNGTMPIEKRYWSGDMNRKVNTIIKKDDLARAISDTRYYKVYDLDNNKHKITVTIKGISAAAQKINTDWSVWCNEVSNITILGEARNYEFRVFHLDEADISNVTKRCS